MISELDTADSAEVQEVLAKNDKSLQKIFSFFCDHGIWTDMSAYETCVAGSRMDQGGKWARADCISVKQFLHFAKECKLSNLGDSRIITYVFLFVLSRRSSGWIHWPLNDTGVSFSICLEIFVTVNQDEVELYCSGQLAYVNLADALQMDFGEFHKALRLMVTSYILALSQTTLQVRRAKWDDQQKVLPDAEKLAIFIKKMLKSTPTNVLKLDV